MSTSARAQFRFDATNHEYIDLETGAVLPHITGMLERTGWIDDTWYTEESSERGTAVHRLTADYDLGALDVESCVSRYRGYLLGHVAAMGILRPEIVAVEEPIINPIQKWGGRPDRVIVVRKLRGVLEIKTGIEARSHQIQTALQAILEGFECGIPAEGLSRQALYLKDKGKFKLLEHRDRRDFIEAQRVIARCCDR
jgi:hypothetical protein